MVKPRIVQMGFGVLGTGGPIGAMSRLVESPSYLDRFESMSMVQEETLGGVRFDVAYRWATAIRRFDPHLAHCRGLGNEGFHAVLACRLAGVPRILLSVHGSHRDLTAPRSVKSGVVGKVIEPLSLHLATDVATVSYWGQNRSYLRRANRKLIGVVPNGVDSKAARVGMNSVRREDFGIPLDSVVIIIVGRLTWEKGHEVLASALSRIDTSRCFLLVVGDGPDRNGIEVSYSSVRGLRYLALGKRDDVHDLMRMSDVMAFSSFHENSPNVLLEALANGLPSVASDIPANAEILQNGGGVLFETGNAESCAAALNSLVADEGLRKKVSGDAKRAHQSQFTLAHMVEGWNDVYGRMLEI